MRDIAVPALPATNPVSGLITDVDAFPIGNVPVAAISQAITGAPGAVFIRSTTGDGMGSYRVDVLSGTAYSIVFLARF
jgi:hypothetical protein